jgi:asparagine synthase (glutamine-hydrolysing)
VSTYFLAQVVSRSVKVAIAGDGADELFGSYLSHRLAARLASPGRPSAGERPELVARLAGESEWQWRHELSVFTDADKRALYSSDVAEHARAFSSAEHLRREFEKVKTRDPLNRVLEAEFRTLLPDQVLTFVDRLSMAHSLEIRSAFLDTDVVTFVAGLPGTLKIRNGETKALLKQAARRYFPDEMVSRAKEGFVMPVTQWLRRDLEPYVRETLGPERLSRHGLFDAHRVHALVDGLYRGEHDHTYVNKILSLIVFQEWYELYMA